MHDLEAPTSPARSRPSFELVAWWQGGERVALRLPEDEFRLRHVFCRVGGKGPWLTPLHGFPASSWDFAPVWGALCTHFRVLAFDFMGYGDSDKSANIPFGTALHASTVAAVWKHFGVGSSYLMGHDIGTAVAQELLARAAEGRLQTDIRACMLMNGVVINDDYRAKPIQRLLLHRLTGPLVARALNERMFTRSLQSSLGPATKLTPEQCAGFWQAMTHRGGNRLLHRLLHHIPERVQHKARWEGVLVSSPVPLRFVWGLADPFAGYVVDHIRRRIREPNVLELPRVGHFPHLEFPEAFVEALLAWAS